MSLPFSFYHCESLESRSQVWFIQSTLLGGSWMGMGAVGRLGVTADVPNPWVQSNSLCGNGENRESHREVEAALFGHRRAESPGEVRVRSSSPSERDRRLCSAPRPSFCSSWLGTSQLQDHHAMNLKSVFPNLWKTDICGTPLEPQGTGRVAEHARLPGLTCHSAMN